MFSLIIIVVYFPLVFAHTLIIFSVNDSPFFSFPLTVLSSSFLLKYIPHHISPFPSPIISPSSLPLPPISLIVLSPHITPRLVLSSFPPYWGNVRFVFTFFVFFLFTVFFPFLLSLCIPYLFYQSYHKRSLLYLPSIYIFLNFTFTLITLLSIFSFP